MEGCSLGPGFTSVCCFDVYKGKCTLLTQDRQQQASDLHSLATVATANHAVYSQKCLRIDKSYQLNAFRDNAFF